MNDPCGSQCSVNFSLVFFKIQNSSRRNKRHAIFVDIDFKTGAFKWKLVKILPNSLNNHHLQIRWIDIIIKSNSGKAKVIITTGWCCKISWLYIHAISNINDTFIKCNIAVNEVDRTVDIVASNCSKYYSRIDCFIQILSFWIKRKG